MTAHLSLPSFARIGAGAVDEIGSVIDQLGLHRPVLVTDSYLTDTGAADRVMTLLRSAGKNPALFSGTVPDPTTDSLEEGLRIVAEHKADSVIGFGGGSPMDTAKALAVLSANGGEMCSYKAPAVHTGPALPIIAIPTTAGSGSAWIAVTVSRPRSGLRPCTNTVAPWAASSSAIERPIPAVAPVTRAV